VIKLKRANVVKVVGSEYKARQLERQGFKRVVEPKKQKKKQEGGE